MPLTPHPGGRNGGQMGSQQPCNVVLSQPCRRELGQFRLLPPPLPQIHDRQPPSGFSGVQLPRQASFQLKSHPCAKENPCSGGESFQNPLSTCVGAGEREEGAGSLFAVWPLWSGHGGAALVSPPPRQSEECRHGGLFITRVDQSKSGGTPPHSQAPFAKPSPRTGGGGFISPRRM